MRQNGNPHARAVKSQLLSVKTQSSTDMTAKAFMRLFTTIATSENRERSKLSMQIIRGHCIDLLPNIGPLDLVVTDPPYAFTGSGPEHEMTATVAIALRECAVKLKKGSWMIVFCASSWRSVNYTIESVRGILDPIRFGTWVKPTSRSRVVIPGWKWSTVNVVAFRKGPKNRVEIKPSEVSDFIIAPPLMVGRRAQLPYEVCRWAVGPFAVPGGQFLDPFAGSGSLVLSAEKFGMVATGFEVQDK